MTISSIFQFTLLAESISNAHVLINEGIARYGGTLICKDFVTAEPGIAVNEGDCYLIGTPSTWPGGHDNNIACRTNDAWVFIAPFNHLNTIIGDSTYVSQMEYYDGLWTWRTKRPLNYITLASGTTTVNFAQGNIMFYTMGTSGLRTMDLPANDMIPGHDYYLIIRNTTGSAINVAFASAQNWSGYTTSSASTPAGGYLRVKLGHVSGGRATIYSIQGALQPV